MRYLYRNVMSIVHSGVVYLGCLVVAAFASCRSDGKLPSDDQTSKASKEPYRDTLNELVLINAGQGDRCDIADLISRVNKCSPDRIGLVLFFPVRRQASRCDTLLQLAISESREIYLLEGVDGDRYMMPDLRFVQFAEGFGPDGIFLAENEFSIYKPVVDDNGLFQLSMPLQLATGSDKEKMKLLISSANPIAPLLTDFKLTELDYDQVSERTCQDIRGKVVLVGFLGPGNEERIIFNNGSTKDSLYTTQLVGYIVQDHLNTLSKSNLIDTEKAKN